MCINHTVLLENVFESLINNLSHELNEYNMEQ